MLTDMTVRQAKATGKPYTIADFRRPSSSSPPTAPRPGTFATPGSAGAVRISWAAILSCRCARPGSCATKTRSAGRQGHQPRTERKQKRQAIKLAGENTFMAVYEKWMEHRQLTLEEGRQSSLEQIRRVFKKDVFPHLKRLTIYEVTRPHLLEVMAASRSVTRCR